MNPTEFRFIGLVRRGLAGAAISVAVMGAFAAQALGAGGPVVTPAGAQAALASYSRQNIAADKTLSIAAQQVGEQGTARILDDSWFQFEAAAGYKTLDGPTFYPFSFNPLEDSVPRQATFPASFAIAARVSYSAGTPAYLRGCPTATSMLVFARKSAATPWKVVLEPTINLSALPKFAASSDGFATAVDPRRLSVAPLRVPRLLAKELRGYEASGKLGTILRSSYFGAQGQCWSIPDVHAAAHTFATPGVSVSFLVTGHRPTDARAFAVTGGAALVIASLNYRWTLHATAPHKIVIRAIAHNPVSHQVPAGSYSSVTEQGICQVAVLDPAKSAHPAAPIRIIGADCGQLPGSGR